MLGLIDGDIIKYSCGFAAQRSVFTRDDGARITISKLKGGMRAMHLRTRETKDFPGARSKKAVLEELGGTWLEEVVPEPEANVCFTVKRMLHHIIKMCGADSYQVFLSKGDCFRVGVYPEYKANRKDTPKPYHIKTIEQYMMTHHPTTVHEEIEADDAMGIMQYQSAKRGLQTIICTKDKDLDMIPGWHYTWQDHSTFNVTEEEGLHAFWCQTLTGDATDNIPGLKGVGKGTAEKILAGVKPSEYKATVLREYADRPEQWGEEEFERNARLLWMLRKPLYETYGMTYEEFFK